MNQLFITAHAGSGSRAANPGAPKDFRGSSVNNPALRQVTRDARSLNDRVVRGRTGQALPSGARQIRRDQAGATVRTGTATVRQRRGGANTIQPGAIARAAQPRRPRRATRD